MPDTPATAETVAREIAAKANELQGCVYLVKDFAPILAPHFQRLTKLEDAIKRAGFAIMQTSGDWSIHDVSEKEKAEQAKTLEVINENVDLQQRLSELQIIARRIISEVDGGGHGFKPHECYVCHCLCNELRIAIRAAAPGAAATDAEGGK